MVSLGEWIIFQSSLSCRMAGLAEPLHAKWCGCFGQCLFINVWRTLVARIFCRDLVKVVICKQSDMSRFAGGLVVRWQCTIV